MLREDEAILRALPTTRRTGITRGNDLHVVFTYTGELEGQLLVLSIA